MAAEHLAGIRADMPDLFENRSLPSDWEDEWILVPVRNPEPSGKSEDASGRSEDALIGEDDWLIPDADLLDGFSVPDTTDPLPMSDQPRLTGEYQGTLPEYVSPEFETDQRGPGLPAPIQPGYAPSPDTLAFYLPFHYFYPHWWGIYLIAEGVQWFTSALHHWSGKALSPTDALQTAKVFLYAHEAFHHCVETFAVRLEMTHRIPLYRKSFEKFYVDTVNTPQCLEESLAEAYAYDRVRTRCFQNNKMVRDTALFALRKSIYYAPEGYRQGLGYIRKDDLSAGKSQFAELNHIESFPQLPKLSQAGWQVFSYLYAPVIRKESQVNYLVRRNSQLAQRQQLSIRYLKRQKTLKVFRNNGCGFKRQGGNHEIWSKPSGGTFPVSRHSGDFHDYEVRAMIREAGLNLSLADFR